MSETPKYAGCAKCGGAAACWCGQPRLDTPAPDHAQARETPTERYERLAEAFYNATGKMAPGKDVSAEMGGDDLDERVALWRVFIAGVNLSEPAASPQEGREADAVAWVPRIVSGEYAGRILLQFACRTREELDGFLEREKRSPFQLSSECEAVALSVVSATPPVAEEGREAEDIHAEYAFAVLSASSLSTARANCERIAEKYRATPPVAPLPPVVTEAMCLAALREDQAQRGESFDALWAELSDKDKAESIEEMRHVILAALASGRES